MAINAEILRALASAGASTEAIIAAVEAQQTIDDRIVAERRRKSRERQRSYRLSHRVTVTSRDSDNAPQAVVETVAEQPQDLAPTLEPEIPVTPQKEIPPTPPKENTTTSKPSSEDLFKEVRDSGTRARRNPRATATRLPEDWQPGDEGWAYALKIGLTEIQIYRQIEEFRDYWHARAGPDALKVSWPATWRRWCRKHLSDYADNGHGQHRNGSFKNTPAGGDSFASYAAKAAQRARATSET